MKPPFTLIHVEDYPSASKAIRGLFRAGFGGGVAVVSAANFEEGFRRVQEAVATGGQILVITDMTFPLSGAVSHEAGLHLVRAIHGTYPEVPCIICADLDNGKIEAELREMEVPVLLKPVRETNLFAAVEQAQMKGPGSRDNIKPPAVKARGANRYG